MKNQTILIRLVENVLNFNYFNWVPLMSFYLNSLGSLNLFSGKFLVAFGEIDISPSLIYLMIGLTVIIFASVGISTLRLFDFDDKEGSGWLPYIKQDA